MAPTFFNTRDRDNYKPLLEFIDLLIVDEAGQAACEVAGATFSLASQALVVGDMMQIQPVWSIPEAVDRGNLERYNLVNSQASWERIIQQGLTASSGCVMTIAQRASPYQKYPEQRGMFLTEHRRCVPEIIQYCNQLCYDGKLQPKRESLSLHQRPLSKSGAPLLPLHQLTVQGTARRVAGSWKNEQEAQFISHWILEQADGLQMQYQKPLQEIVGVVTPFTKQAELIQIQLSRLGVQGLTVGTVHRLQGAERLIVLFSTVYDATYRGAYFFDRDVRMLNVAVSRAKDSFIVIGDAFLLNPQKPETPSGLLASLLPERVYLNVPYAQKEAAKQLGAKWDKDAKRWFVPPGISSASFTQWLPTS